MSINLVYFTSNPAYYDELFNETEPQVDLFLDTLMELEKYDIKVVGLLNGSSPLYIEETLNTTIQDLAAWSDATIWDPVSYDPVVDSYP